MLKKFILCLVIFLAIFTIFFQKKLDKSEIEKGITLDIARKHYTEHSIKQIIKHLSKHHGTYLQLHFSDNENYSIYSKMLKQTSNKTNSYFLTKKRTQIYY
ncbi:family 20 glycosylhydrolase [Staphylococcus pasteuri]